MKAPEIFVAGLLVLISHELFAQPVTLNSNNLVPVNVSMSFAKINGKSAVRVIKDSAVKGSDEATFVRVNNVDLGNGTIEVKVLSRLLPDASPGARGFIGLAFRVSKANDKFECMYIRPTNGRAEDQVRRNHATQYFAYPGYTFESLRRDAPGVYESYADMELNRWITLRIVVKNAQAKLFLDNNTQPALIVNDLKNGPLLKGAIGLFVDGGTEGFFSDIRIRKDQ